MNSMVLPAPAPAETRPLRLREGEVPKPAADELLVRVEVCGVCRTDLHIVEGDLEPFRGDIVPGHEVVGRVERCGRDVTAHRPGDRVGIAWLHRACGGCRFCHSARENLCISPHFTGWEIDGGYAEYARVPAEFAYRIADSLGARDAAPLLCAGIIGYRAYRRSGVQPGGRLGFGGSGHIAIQIARHHGCEVAVFSRGDRHRELAEEIPIRTFTVSYPLADANEALIDLKQGRVQGAAVLDVADVDPGV